MKIKKVKDIEVNKNNKEVVINKEQMKVVEKELQEIKENEIKRNDNKYKKIIQNLLIGIIMIIYFYLLFFWNKSLGIINYTKYMKYILLSEVVISVILFEISFKLDNDSFSLNSIEFLIMTVLSIVYYNLKLKQYAFLDYFLIIVFIITGIYYLIKSIVIDIKKEENNFII